MVATFNFACEVYRVTQLTRSSIFLTSSTLGNFVGFKVIDAFYLSHPGPNIFFHSVNCQLTFDIHKNCFSFTHDDKVTSKSAEMAVC